MYKLIVIDMDGILLNDYYEVMVEVCGVFDVVKVEGVNIVLCMGWLIGGVWWYLEELNLQEEGDFVIVYNGVFV